MTWTPQQQLNEDFLWAVWAGNIAEMEVLLARGAYTEYTNDEDNYTALFNSVATGKIEVARFLLENNANPNTRNYRLETPMMFARTPEMIKLLAEYNANPWLRNKDGDTAHALFAHNKRYDLLAAYKEAGLPETPRKGKRTKAKSRRSGSIVCNIN